MNSASDHKTNEERQPYIIWLPSWYPSKFEPFSGDFIQRHAQAASLYCSIVVCHFPQLGYKMKVNKSSTEIKHLNKNLKEIIHYIAFQPTGITFLDQLIYNLLYYRAATRYLKNYFKKFGLPDLVHVHIPAKAGSIAMWIKKKKAIPYIVSDHSGHYEMNSADDFFKRSVIHRNRVKRIFRNADIVTNVSFFFGKKLKKIFSLKHVHVIYNTADTSLFNYKAANFSKFRFIHVSTLSEIQKNIRGILTAAKSLYELRQDFDLIIVGPFTPELKQLIIDFNLESLVTLTGEVTYEEVAKQMRQSSSLILFSKYENLPCVIIEALCCGLPVITSEVGGISEIINKENGILIQSENETQLTQSMSLMIDQYQNYNKEQIARDAHEKFSYSVIGKQFHELYKKLLQQA